MARILVKAVTWQLMGLVTMTGVGWALTGSVAAGGAFAALGAAVSLVGYVLHEKLWALVRWGRALGALDPRGG
jgi:uncharacterized membrane protein